MRRQGEHRSAVGAHERGVEILLDGMGQDAAPVLDLQARLDEFERLFNLPDIQPP
jgi:hypothetical protein